MAKDTKAKIVEDAGKLLWFHGYEGTSLNDVVDKAGVSKGAFFHYYPNKQAVVQDVIDQYAQDHLISLMEKCMSGTTSVKSGLLNWVHFLYVDVKSRGYKGGCLLGNMALEMSDSNDAVRERLAAHFLEWENRLASYLRPLNAEGKLAIEHRQFARLLICAIQGATMTAKAHKDNNRASREFQAIAQMIETLVKG